MIKIIGSYNNKPTESVESDETEFTPYSEYSAIFDRMEEYQCHTLVVQLDNGRQVLFTISDVVKSQPAT